MKRLRSWAIFFEPSVINLIGQVDVLMQSETTEIVKPLMEEEYMDMISTVTPSFSLGSGKSTLLAKLAYTCGKTSLLLSNQRVSIFFSL